jgi:hypothetical protein
MDLYGNNSASISMGNARRQQVRDFNEQIKQHNDTVTQTMNGLLDQQKTTQTIQQAQDTAKSLWIGSKMPDRIQAFKQWNTARSGVTPEAQALKPPISTPPAGTSTTLASDVVEEGGLGRSIGQAVSGAGKDIGSALENAGGAAGSIKSAAGIVKSSGGEIAESLGSKVAGGVGKAAGGALAAAMGGMDAYEDLKAGHIVGNNNWEKAGNILQMGGAVADVVGMAFPPAALLGGVLDLASGATSLIGEKLDTTEADATKTAAANDTEKPEAAPVLQEQASSTVGRVMG